jgi:hypothetical protein
LHYAQFRFTLPRAATPAATSKPTNAPHIMKTTANKRKSFKASVNWEFVHAHHPSNHGKVKPGPWVDKIITHARENGFKGKITADGAARIINSNLY